MTASQDQSRKEQTHKTEILQKNKQLLEELETTRTKLQEVTSTLRSEFESAIAKQLQEATNKLRVECDQCMINTVHNLEWLKQKMLEGTPTAKATKGVNPDIGRCNILSVCGYTFDRKELIRSWNRTSNLRIYVCSSTY